MLHRGHIGAAMTDPRHRTYGVARRGVRARLWNVFGIISVCVLGAATAVLAAIALLRGP